MFLFLIFRILDLNLLINFGSWFSMYYGISDSGYKRIYILWLVVVVVWM